MGPASLAIPVVVGIRGSPVVGIRGSPVVAILAILGSLGSLGGRDPGPGSRRRVRWRCLGGI